MSAIAVRSVIGVARGCIRTDQSLVRPMVAYAREKGITPTSRK